MPLGALLPVVSVKLCKRRGALASDVFLFGWTEPFLCSLIAPRFASGESVIHLKSPVFCSAAAPFFRPGLTADGAPRAVAVKGSAEQPGATRSPPLRGRAWRGLRALDLDGREHGATLDRAGRLSCRVMVLSAVCWQPQHGIGEVGAPMSRTRSPRAGRNEEREVAGPRPGWDMLPPGSGGSRTAPGWNGCDHAAAGASPQSKSRSSFQTRSMMVANLRATATLARRMPIRLARARPQVLSFDVRG
jgi:hypothetical protein